MLQIIIKEWYHSEIAKELGKCLVKSRALDNYTFYSCNSATKDQCCVLRTDVYRVDKVSHSFMGKKDFPNSWPLCHTKFSLYVFVLFAIFGKAQTFCQSIKRE